MSAKQTPLPDLLDRVPDDIVLGIPGDEPMFPSYTNIPIGKLAQEAAAELRRLQALLEAEQALHQRVTYPELQRLRAQRDALRAELKEATEAINDPAVNNLRTLAESIRMLSNQRDALLEALQALYDEQQGPPLIRHQAAWEAAMEKARAAIKAVEEGRPCA